MSNSAQRAYGICLGASTISAVALKRDGWAGLGVAGRGRPPEPDPRIGGPPGGAPHSSPQVERVVLKAHEGNPRGVFEEVIREIGVGGSPILVTGRKFRNFVKLPSVTEPEAVEYALRYIEEAKRDHFDALVSAGGETFMVYALNRDHQITGVSTGNKCASGTGEFFLQQIRRMNLEIGDAVDLASVGEPYPVSGRCSVFCKSDCTHALNKGEPITDVTAGLCDMVAKKIIEIVDKVPHDHILLVGGTSRNRAVLNYLKKHLKNVVVPQEAAYFEALGAALAAFEHGTALPETVFNPNQTSFSSLSPLKDFESSVTFNTIRYAKAETGDRCLIGLDVGSTTTKAIILRLEDHVILDSVYLRTNGNPVEASRACFKTLLENLGGTDLDLIGIGVTGSGRQIAGLYALTEGIINEIIAHASAAVFFDPEVDTIFEIGGQDAKYTYITGSVASDYAMNQACSAGTGSFLEEAAFETLGVRMEDIADLALQGQTPPNFNDQCAAFISSDIKNAAHEGLSQNDILAGLVYSICFNYINRVKGARPVGKKVFMQGGVCYNRAVPLAMAAVLNKHIVVPPEPGLTGAFGVALELEKRIELGLVKQKSFDLEAIVGREITYGKTFICPGGKERCDLKCSVIRVRIDGKVYPFGGACNRYYNLRHKKEIKTESRDYVKIRNNLMFGKYAPERPVKPGTPTIGLNTSFLAQKLYPLYYNFFSHLGCAIVTPDEPVPTAVNRLVTSMCFPAEISIALFENLISKNPDYVFMPFAKELFVPGGIDRLDFCATCGFSRGEGFVLRQAYHGSPYADRILSPSVNFNGGWEKGEKAFLDMAKKLGFSRREAREAFSEAVRAQYAFEEECQDIGSRLLDEVHRDPERNLIVLFGRAYNAYAPEANKGIPQKILSRNYTIMPFDMITYAEEQLTDPYGEYMHWEAGQRILRVAQIVKRDRQLFGVFITNFLCAPDSFIVSYFRKLMGSKPSLTLELDAHAADAGINTRIEAFLDIIQNYQEVCKNFKRQQGKSEESPGGVYRPARVVFEHQGTVYVDSQGKRYGLSDPNVKMLMPPMGIVSSRALAAVCRKLGFRTEALPPSDAEVLRLGRSITTGKECLPLIVCIGALAKYLKHRPKNTGEKLLYFLPKATGHCRLGQYHVYTNLYIKESKLKDAAVLDLGMEQRFAGLGPSFSINAWRALVVADVLEDIAFSIITLAEEPKRGLEIFDEECDRIIASLDGSSETELYPQLKGSAQRLREIPLKASYEETARVAITGEFFVRRDPFSNLGLARRLADKGFLVTTDPSSGIVYYANFMIREKIVEPHYTLAGWLEFIISAKTQRFVERKIKKILSASGLFTPELFDVYDLIGHSEFVIPRDCDGEQGIIIGLTMRDSFTEYCGIANVGPFGCMQTRFGDAVIIPRMDMKGKRASFEHVGKKLHLSEFTDEDKIPFLSVESDGNPYPQLLEARFDSFCLEAERIAGRQGKKIAK